MNKSMSRNTRGNMLFLIVCIATVVFVPMLILLCRLGPFAVKSGRAQNVVEAAGLLAANDLSRIVINDPTFGYVSLSNYPAEGKATLAPDGEPLPVLGINTLIGTLRQNAIIAEELRNPTLFSLVDRDLLALRYTKNTLREKLSDAIAGSCREGDCVDQDGNDVSPLEDVRTFLQDNLPAGTKLESLELSLGWLQDGSDTIVPVPKPERLARLQAEDSEGGNYEAFKDVPVGRRKFSFAGLGAQSHLVSTRKFQPDDGAHLCTVLKIQCTVSTKEEPNSKITCVACCQPYSRPDQTTGGAMTVRFSGRSVPGLLSWQEFLSPAYFQDNKITTYIVRGGDYPFDSEAKMRQLSSLPHSDTSQQFAAHLYYWLRNGHLRPSIESVLNMLNEPFQSRRNQVYAYEFAPDGKINKRVFDGERFTRSVTADGQYTVMADTRVSGGASAVIFFRDNVIRLASKSGKHGGQALAGYPLANLDGWMDHSQLANEFHQRRKHSAGLAVDIEIGGTGESTAQKDVISMRQKAASRKI